MGRKNDLENAVDDIVFMEMDTRYGTTVPTSDSVKLSNGGVYLEAVYLYTDMANSTGLTRFHTDETSAKIIKSFLTTATRILRHHGGEIRSYDGDRVMSIFIGDEGATKAVKAALEIKWAVENVVRPSLRLAVDEYKEDKWQLSHRTGIDYGWALIARAGVRNNNDLVSIGDAPNIAAKLSDLKGHRTFITDRVWIEAAASVCISSSGKSMWSSASRMDIGGGRSELVRYSDWGWIIS
ncbi:adenylate/guanylate cyclase domain-containing protein [Pseudarthrobacter sp. ATCC 49987]|uniref:adenylate/guanylate cyclase domain-containing protein n=1 Tax=Pseudarthrobacter sp. ATCC 49987 TaxID=2698204 RepID=UPI00136DC8AE|nr:adenylate/guanylate cyclase domain-containing protein [Pseudarthrobacter sp. ATCC 49987]